jgi:hypothetical protein
MPTLWNDVYFPNRINRYIAHQNSYHKIHVGSNWSLQIRNDHVHKYKYDSTSSHPWKALLVALELYPQSPFSSSCSSCSHLFIIFSNLPLLTSILGTTWCLKASPLHILQTQAFLHHLFTSLNTILLCGVSPNDKGLHLSLENSLRNHW